MVMQLEEKSGVHQSHYGSSSGHHEYLNKMTWQSAL